MKLLFDFLPILLFFGTFKYADANKDWAAGFATDHLGFAVSGGIVDAAVAPVLLATVVVILATVAQVSWFKLRGRKVDMMLWVSLGLVILLGGATVWFHNETFIKWKPSLVYWVLGAVFLASQLAGKNLLRVLLGEQLELPDVVWQRLNAMWVGFFGFMGLLNIWVAYSFATETWVNFKLGSIGLTLLFTLAQGLYLARHLKDDEAQARKPGPSA